MQGITVKVVNNGESAESIVVARILRGGLADTFGKKVTLTDYSQRLTFSNIPFLDVLRYPPY